MPDPAAEDIASALQAFLKRGGVRRVHMAGGCTVPPQLAYLVNSPRLSIILAGEDLMDIEQQGKAAVIAVKGGDAVFVPANCWNRPAWSRRVKVLTFLFGKRQTGASLVSQPGRNAS